MNFENFNKLLDIIMDIENRISKLNEKINNHLAESNDLYLSADSQTLYTEETEEGNNYEQCKHIEHFYKNFVLTKLTDKYAYASLYPKFFKTLGAQDEIRKINYDIMDDKYKITELNNNDKLTVNFIPPYHYYKYTTKDNYNVISSTGEKGTIIIYLRDEPIEIHKINNVRYMYNKY